MLKNILTLNQKTHGAGRDMYVHLEPTTPIHKLGTYGWLKNAWYGLVAMIWKFMLRLMHTSLSRKCEVFGISAQGVKIEEFCTA